MYLQAMPEKDAGNYPINPIDITWVLPHEDPPMKVGVFELDLRRCRVGILLAIQYSS
jgi:catalase